jgi:sec-independent protein translocase protein TatC
MTLIQHLVELRRRLFFALVGIVLGTIVGWLLYDPLWAALYEPIKRIAEARGVDEADITLTYTTITGAFEQHLQISIVAGIVVSSPIWLYQIFAFLVPGLTKREKRYTFGFFFSAVPLFLAGCAAGWFVLPHIVEVMTVFIPPQTAGFFDARPYLDFVLKLVLATGIAFVLPVFLVLLNFLGLLQGPTILKGWRWAVLAITVFAAIATPAADILSMLLLMLPMIVLYFAAVGIALIHDRWASKRQEALLDDAGLPVTP